MCDTSYFENNPNISVVISLKDWNDVKRRLDALERGRVYTPTPRADLCTKCKQWHVAGDECLPEPIASMMFS